jgi:hypothetical protein
MKGASFRPRDVPVRPNAGRVIGQVQSVAPHPGRAQDAIVSFLVQESKDIAGMPNFVASEAGRVIQVVVRRAGATPASSLRAGARAELIIRYEGDERGGGFYANAADYRPLDE